MAFIIYNTRSAEVLEPTKKKNNNLISSGFEKSVGPITFQHPLYFKLVHHCSNVSMSYVLYRTCDIL